MNHYKRMKSSLGLELIDKGKQPPCLIDADQFGGRYLLMHFEKVFALTNLFFMDDWDSWKKYFTSLNSTIIS